MPPRDEPIQLEIAPDVLSLYWVENVGIVCWHKPLSAPVIEALHREAEPQRRRYPSGMSFVHIGQPEYALIDAATRETFVRILKELDGYAAATAIIVRASGFWASALRSVATGIVFLARSSAELRLHENVDELMAWLPAKHEAVTGVKLDLERLRRVLNKAVESV